MQLIKDTSFLANFSGASECEYLETNGLGGWSGSSITGAHTRRYHGLFVAAVHPPADRMVMLSKLDETIVSGSNRFELGSNVYSGDVIHPKGNQYLKRFTKNYFPEWVYEVNGFRLVKTICMVYEENTVVVQYKAEKADAPFTLELMPLMAGRNYHECGQASPRLHWDVDFREGVFCNRPDGINAVYMAVPGAEYRHAPVWYYHFKYNVEQYRGLDYTEDLLNHGVFSISLKEGDELNVIISSGNTAGREGAELIRQELKRRKALLQGIPGDETLKQLTLAADQFIVRRYSSSGQNTPAALKTVIAGYHWFTDWGRDTMISLPGLTLSTGRFADARKILSAFAETVSQGMLPNRFQEKEPPEYNNVDGTLWYFIAVYKYLQASGDADFVIREILPVLTDIISWHLKGTRYHIHMAEDGLLFAGEPGQQLTWMDARIGNWVVTPRMGKPVEIQALWYNALKITAALLRLRNKPGTEDDIQLAARMEQRATKVKESFDRLFWFSEGNYCYDLIDEHGTPDPVLRPNQLFAVSLPFALLGGEKAEAVLQSCREKLYTPVGLRSLPEDDAHYIRQYGGDPRHRDASYHQGTVWSWLLGAYVDAIMKGSRDDRQAEANAVIERFRYHLNEACIGQVSEIFDGAAPHHPRGCVAQAWGVAELLRVIKAYSLFKHPG